MRQRCTVYTAERVFFAGRIVMTANEKDRDILDAVGE